MAITANCSAVTCPVFDISMHSQTVSERTNERTNERKTHLVILSFTPTPTPTPTNPHLSHHVVLP